MTVQQAVSSKLIYLDEYQTRAFCKV